MSSNVGDLPAELQGRPCALIALTGLNLVHNAIHMSIWDAFSSNRRPDRVPVAFLCLAGDHEYHKPKDKRVNYDWYVPKGILKKSWLDKHLNKIPAVTVIFYDLDWDEPQWAERLEELTSKTEVVRSALQGRNTKIAVVLIQKNVILPPGEDSQATERAAAVCSACNLSTKALFVLPHSDPLIGYVIRLENALFELAQNYYHQEVRRVKGHRELLNKTNHQLLFIRHHIKMAMFNELKQDVTAALKQYKQAYLNLLDIRTTDINLLEIKVIAGFVSYKICRLSFQLNTPLDAISQFRKHVDIFKNKLGPKELAFEHSAWMSKQFSAFGDLFDEAIKNGLTAIQTQHPGFYYQQSAYHSIARRKLCQQLCGGVDYPIDNPLVDDDQCEYYGQRMWRPGVHSLECTNQVKEKEGIAATQYKELNEVVHSQVVIPLLKKAINQFRKFRCVRMHNFLTVQLAEEHFHAKEHSVAYSLLTHVQWNYREEKWWSLFTHTFAMSLRCAYSIAALQDYVTLCIELIGPNTQLTVEEKTRIQKNMQRVLSLHEPEPEPGCQADIVEQVLPLWKHIKPSVSTVEMNTLASFVQCKATFKQATFLAIKEICGSAFVQVHSPIPVNFSKLCIFFSNEKYNSQCTFTSLTSEPGKITELPFKFYSDKADVSKEVSIKSIALYLGNEQEVCFILHWSFQQFVPVETICQGSSTKNYSWNTLPSILKCGVQPRTALVSLKIQHDPPAMLQETYICKVTCKNEENLTISKIRITASVSCDLETSSQPATVSTNANVESTDTEASISIQDLSSGQETQTSFFVRAATILSLTCDVTVRYDISTKVGNDMVVFACEKTEKLIVPTISPFNVTTKVTNVRLEPCLSVCTNTPFLVIMNIENLSPGDIHLYGSEYQLTPIAKSLDQEQGSQLVDVVLKGGDQASTCLCLQVSQSSQLPLDIGTLVIRWKRVGLGDQVPLVETIIPLPAVSCAFVPVHVSLEVAAYGNVRTPLPVSYLLQNCTNQTQDIEFLMEASDSFMFAGYKQLHCRLLPQDRYTVTFNLYPLVPGYVLLPRLRVVLTPGKTLHSELEQAIQSMLPSHVFVKSRDKLTDAA